MYKRITTLMLTAVLSLAILPSHMSAHYDQREVVILFKEKVDSGLIVKLSGEIINEFDTIPAVSALVPANAIPLLIAQKEVQAVEENQKLTISNQTKSWGYTSVKTERSAQSNLTGKNIKIAILDTGISPHPDLNITGGKSFVSYTDSYADDEGHGTLTAGVIGALNNTIGSVGVAPGASLYSVKIMDQDGDGHLLDLLEGLDWSIANDMDIINMSLGFKSEKEISPLQMLLEEAYEKGILLVAAAGNNGNANGTGDTVTLPARDPSVIAVSAIDEDTERASFSASGTSIEVTAPGVNILSTLNNGKYAKYNGTSASAPFVTGMLALLKERYPTDSHKSLRTKLQFLTKDLGPNGKDSHFGYGLIQAPSNTSKVSRLGGKDRFEVAVNVSKTGWQKSDTVILANYLAFADALSAAPLAYKYDAPILLTPPDRLEEKTRNEIKRLNPKKIILVGGQGSITPNVSNELRALGITDVSRIGGNDRFEVSQKIAEKFPKTEKIVIANGLNFPDALAIAPYAAKEGIPILLTTPNRLPEPTKKAISSLQEMSTIVSGGPASVSSNQFPNFLSPQRIDGKDRYQVAENVIQKLNLQPKKVFFATGLTFADALTGSVLAAKENANILLSRPDNLGLSSLDLVEQKTISDFTVLGGEGSIQSKITIKLENQ